MNNELKLSIKAARSNVNLTQSQIAKMLGVSRETYLGYEHGDKQMKISTALRFSEITNVPIDNIIFFNKNYTSSV